MNGIQKNSVTVLVSEEMARAFGFGPDRRTDVEREADTQRWQQQRRAARERAQRYIDRWAADSTTLGQVANLHRPIGDDLAHARCEGCDDDGYESEHPRWPCRTAELIEGEKA